MYERERNRWLWGTIAASLALIVCGTCLAGPPQDARRIETIVVGDDSEPAFLWVEGGTRAFLGVQVEEETENEEGGARVTGVVDDSPAAKAAIMKGDIIVQFGGETVRGPVGLTTKIHEKEPGDEVAIVVVRDGKKTKLEAVLGDAKESGVRTMTMSFLGDLPDDFVLPEIDIHLDEQLKENMEKLKDRYVELYHCEPSEEDCTLQFFSGFAGRPTLGVQLVETTPELREHLGGSEDAGVLVSKVLSGTPAREAGILVGDLIVEIDGDKVARSSDVRRALAGKRGSSVEVVVVRDGERITIDVELPEQDEDWPTGPRAMLVEPGDCAHAPLVEPAGIRRIIVPPPAKAAPPARPIIVVPPTEAVPPAPPAPRRTVQRLTSV